MSIFDKIASKFKHAPQAIAGLPAQAKHQIEEQFDHIKHDLETGITTLEHQIENGFHGLENAAKAEATKHILKEAANEIRDLASIGSHFIPDTTLNLAFVSIGVSELGHQLDNGKTGAVQLAEHCYFTLLFKNEFHYYYGKH